MNELLIIACPDPLALAYKSGYILGSPYIFKELFVAINHYAITLFFRLNIVCYEK